MFKKFLARFLVILILVCPICLTACGKKETTPTKTLESISSEMILKTNYFVGDTLVLDDYKITLNYSDKSTKEVSVTADMVSGFDTTTAGEKTMTITHSKKTMEIAYTVVEPKVTSISIKTPFTKTNYFEGEDLDVTGAVITATYENGKIEDVDVTADMVSDFDNTASAEDKTMTITYGGKTTTATYHITAIVVTSIKVSSDFDYDYFVGEQLNIANGKLEATKNNGEKETISISKQMISGFSSETAGSRALTITYAGVTTTKTYTVTAIVVTKIELKTTFKTDYFVGDALDVTGGTLLASKNNNTTEIINITKEMVSNFINTEASTTNKLRITYSGKTLDISYTITAVVPTSIELESAFKNKYFHYDQLDLTGGKIKVTFNNETTELVDITADMISGFINDPPECGEYEMDLTYAGISIKVPYTIQAIELLPVEQGGITLKTPFTKTTYFVGEEFDVSDGTLELKYNNGTTEIIPVTIDMIRVFPNKVAGENKSVTIRYNRVNLTVNGFTILEVVPTELVVTDAFKTDYLVGEALDVTGGKIEVTFNNGTTKTVDITTDMISGFSTEEAGSKELTITYQGATVQVAYEVA